MKVVTKTLIEQVVKAEREDAISKKTKLVIKTLMKQVIKAEREDVVSKMMKIVIEIIMNYVVGVIKRDAVKAGFRIIAGRGTNSIRLCKNHYSPASFMLTFLNKQRRRVKQLKKSNEIWQLSIQRYAFLLFLSNNCTQEVFKMFCLQMMSGRIADVP